MWVVEIAITSLLTAMVGAMWAYIVKLARDMRASNKATRAFERSMQRAELNRYFRIVVEQGNAISPEELSHLESCYKAYHENGGNGVGTLMFERICEYARLVTQVKEVTDEQIPD